MPSATFDWRTRIAADPAVHHGVPCIIGTRVAVSVIVGSIADGDSPEQIIRSYPQLTSEDIRAALHFAADAVRTDNIVPLRRAS